ncbi:POU domain, class 6, transcription factor 2 [Chelonia mydas]|uniref:POU domain, class 6, transcription factor 2 n=1 Tax=Chelonia mydas TaxID=8469 RepID=M7BM45_CHEMY|nr:POU domain, class 6, transcription factor 2 [Chelonia mydas]
MYENFIGNIHENTETNSGPDPAVLFEEVVSQWARGNPVLSDTSTADQHQLSQSHPAFPVGPQPLLTAQQLASAVAGVMPGGTPALNQPILIPFNMAGQLGGQQGLVLTLPTANLTNIQGLVAAAAAGGIMTLPLQNLQGKPHQSVFSQHSSGSYGTESYRLKLHLPDVYTTVDLYPKLKPHRICDISRLLLIWRLTSSLEAKTLLRELSANQFILQNHFTELTEQCDGVADPPNEAKTLLRELSANQFILQNHFTELTEQCDGVADPPNEASSELVQVHLLKLGTEPPARSVDRPLAMQDDASVACL